MAQVPAPRLGEQIVAAVLKSLLVTPVVTDDQGSQAAMWAFFCRMLISSCAQKGAGSPRWLRWLCLQRSTTGALVAATAWLSHGYMQSNVQQLFHGIYPFKKHSTK